MDSKKAPAFCKNNEATIASSIPGFEDPRERSIASGAARKLTEILIVNEKETMKSE